MSGLIKLTPTEPNLREILRYAGGSADQNTLALVDECLAEAIGALSFGVCYRILRVNITDSLCDFEQFSVKSRDLAKNLNGCAAVCVFGATLGSAFDRLLIKYSRISPAKALIFQAIGAERTEALRDAFCEKLKADGYALKPRFSAGYGDLPLEANRDIFAALNLEKNLGITLNRSMLMSPSKSVTAFVGILEEKYEN
mgnify:CR=1 FL=1